MSNWIEWHGGYCPIGENVKVEVMLRSGENKIAEAGSLFWEHNSGIFDEIVAYRLHETDSQRIDRLERELAELKAERTRGYKILRAEIHPPELEKWEPEGGKWIITGCGVIKDEIYPEDKAHGLTRHTRELAEKSRYAMRIHNRALAYVHEHAPDWQGGNDAAVVYWNGAKWSAVSIGVKNDLGAVIGPYEVMQKLADDLNSGRVEL